jgi:biotin operon repressor
MKTDVNAVVVNVGDVKHHLDIGLENTIPKYLVMISSEGYQKELSNENFVNELIQHSKGQLSKNRIFRIMIDPFEIVEPVNSGEYGELPVIGKIIDKFATMKKEIENDNRRDNINWIASLNGGTNQQAAAVTILAIMYKMKTYYVLDWIKDKTKQNRSEYFNWVTYISDISEGVDYLKRNPAQKSTLLLVNKYDEISRDHIGKKFEIQEAAISKRINPLVKRGYVKKESVRRRRHALQLQEFTERPGKYMRDHTSYKTIRYGITSKGKIIASILSAE